MLMLLATAWAARFEPVCLRAGCLFHKVIAWSARVFAPCGSRGGMMPAVTDLVGLEMVAAVKGGKRTLPSVFLVPFGPSEL